MNTRLLAPLAGLLLMSAAIGAVIGAPAKKAKCVVSGKEIEVTDKTLKVSVQGKTQYFCCENCPKAFAKEPEKFVKDVADCPILGSAVNSPNAAERLVLNNGLWYVCCPACVDGVAKNEKVLKALTDVVSGKAFKASEQSPRTEYKAQLYLFENAETKAAFDKEPARFAVVYGK
ncbi:MAG: hypothetical protein ACO1SX_17745 [Actinomycetota bacterium]